MFYVGVNFDITNIVAAVIDDDGNILVKESAPTLKYRELTEIIGDMAALI